LAPVGAAWANRSDQIELSAYVQARAADSLGAADKAVVGYGFVLESTPGNPVVASRALRQALAAGDRPLALKAARILQSADVSAPDVQLLLLAEAVTSKDWADAGRQIDALEGDEVFAFMAPVLRAWVALGSGEGDSLAQLQKGASDPLGGSYVAGHRPLLLLASGRDREGLLEVRNRVEAQDTRSQRLQLAAASYLAKRGKREQALAVLEGDRPVLAAARTALEKRKRFSSAIVKPEQGIAELFLRLAIDLRQQDVPMLALSFARLSTFLDPEHFEGWLVASEMLVSEGQEREALVALDNIPRAEWPSPLVADFRIRLLATSGDKETALSQAAAAVKAKNADAADWTRLGDIYGELNRHRESADAYGMALALPQKASGGRPPWTLWLLRGGALEQAGAWPEAKAALVKAYELAPQEPLVLNYLGYAQLERRENLGEAEKLIREASRLQPESPQITDSLGWAHYLKGDVHKAIELLERAVEGEPSDAAINEHLGDAYFSAGRRFEARYAWTAALLTAEEADMERIRAKIDIGLKPELASP
jgi:Flp pilus assembly protein TadD